MVIGDGLVARSFKHYEKLDEFLIFASGVSHSKSCTEVDFNRERALLTSSLQAHASRNFVYFGTTSVADPDLGDSPYVRHKLAMEELIRKEARLYHIFRLSNLAGRSVNPNTVLNFFYNHIVNGIPFQLWKHSERNIIDVEDAFLVIDHILKDRSFSNQVINIANEQNYPVPYIVRCIEHFTGRRADFIETGKGEKFQTDLSAVLPLYKKLKIGFGDSYLPRILEKYYTKK